MEGTPSIAEFTIEYDDEMIELGRAYPDSLQGSDQTILLDKNTDIWLIIHSEDIAHHYCNSIFAIHEC